MQLPPWITVPAGTQVLLALSQRKPVRQSRRLSHGQPTPTPGPASGVPPPPDSVFEQARSKEADKIDPSTRRRMATRLPESRDRENRRIATVAGN